MVEGGIDIAFTTPPDIPLPERKNHHPTSEVFQPTGSMKAYNAKKADSDYPIIKGLAAWPNG